MPEAISVSAPVSETERTLSFETGRLAPQADGAVVVRLGDTMVLVTAVMSRSVREGADFFPLTVDVEERMYAAGKIPGSFFRREGKASDQAILTARLIDRPLRPSFPKGVRNEVHVVATILGADLENPHDILAINGASAALMVSGIPFDGPIGAVRIAYGEDGRWIPHATYQEGDASTFELVVAGRTLGEGPDADVAIMMVEAGGTEDSFRYYAAGAPKVTEEVLAEGLEVSKRWIRESVALQRELVAKAGSPEPIKIETFAEYGDDVYDEGRAGRRRAAPAGQRHGGQGRAQRRHRRGHGQPRRHPGAGIPSRGSERSRPPPRTWSRSWCGGGSSRRGSASTAARPPTSGHCRQRWTSSRRRTGLRCSSGARPRSSPWPPWACPG